MTVPEDVLIGRYQRAVQEARDTRAALRAAAYDAGRWMAGGLGSWLADEVRALAGDDVALARAVDAQVAAGLARPYHPEDVARLLVDERPAPAADDVEAVPVGASPAESAEAAAGHLMRTRCPIRVPGGLRWTRPALSPPLASAADILGAWERLTWIGPRGGQVRPPSVRHAVWDLLLHAAPQGRIGGCAWVDGQWVQGVGLHGHYYCTDPVTAAHVPVSEAVEALLGPFVHFPILDTSDRIQRLLAAVLTPFLVPSISGPIPGLLVAAHLPGAGKTLLARVIGAIADAEGALLASWPADGAEADETLISGLEQGRRVVILDNLRGRLASPLLEACWTSREIYGRRKYARSETRRVDAVICVTGNDPQVTRDVARRVVRIRVDRGGAPPPPDLPDVMAMVRDQRPRLLGAVRALLEAWHAAGAPRVPVAGAASYEDWASTVAGVLRVAGVLPDDWRPIDADAVAADHDPDTIEMGRVVEAWAEAEAQRGTLGSWRGADEVARMIGGVLRGRRGRPDLVVAAILTRASYHGAVSGLRVDQSRDGDAWRLVTL